MGPIRILFVLNRVQTCGWSPSFLHLPRAPDHTGRLDGHEEPGRWAGPREALPDPAQGGNFATTWVKGAASPPEGASSSGIPFAWIPPDM